MTGAALRSLATELRGSARCATIATHPLSMEDVHAYLIARFGPGRVETLSRTLHRVTGGIPLSVVAVTDGLIEADYLTLTDNAWRLRYSPRMIEKSLPKRLLDVVFWRFEQLGPEDRAVLEIAAAVGTEFTAADVAHAADIDTPFAVRRRLERSLSAASSAGAIPRRRRHRGFPVPASDARRRVERERAAAAPDSGRETPALPKRSRERFG